MFCRYWMLVFAGSTAVDWSASLLGLGSFFLAGEREQEEAFGTSGVKRD